MKKWLFAILGISFFGQVALLANVVPNTPPSCIADYCAPDTSCWGDHTCCADWKGGWGGVYVGFNAGWGLSNANFDATPFGERAIADFIPQSVNNRINGPMFGIQAGFNWQICSWIVGLEGDFDGTGINGFNYAVFPSQFASGFFSTNATSLYANIDWLSSARARIGMACSSWLIYVSGGAAWERLRFKTLSSSQTAGGIFEQNAVNTFSKTRTGWVVGGGFEKMIACRWSLRAEYLHYQFNKRLTGIAIFPNAATPNNGIQISTDRASIDTFRLGVNYIFSL